MKIKFWPFHGLDSCLENKRNSRMKMMRRKKMKLVTNNKRKVFVAKI